MILLMERDITEIRNLIMVNNLGVDPNEWFPNPLDSMPVATNKTFDWDDTAPS